jgi:hypothetical protein
MEADELNIGELKRNIQSLMDYLGWPGDPTMTMFPQELATNQRQHMFTKYSLTTDEIWCFGYNDGPDGATVDEVTFKKVTSIDKVTLLKAMYRFHLNECLQKAQSVVLTKLVVGELQEGIGFDPATYAKQIGV